MLIFLCVCMSAHVCVCVCVSRLPILFSFSPTHQAPRVWWAVISGCLCADGGGLEEGVKSADGRSESFKRCFKTHHGAFDGGGEYGQRKYPQNDTCEMGDWVNTESCLMWGSQGNNCKRKRCGNKIQGCVHLHETLSRHQCLKYEFYSGRSLLNKCKALSAKCCTNQS